MQYGKSQEGIDRLTAERRRVIQEAGTERPFTGEYNDRTERLRSMAGCVEDPIE